ncbi:MAG: hypothetical protein AAF236_12840 [Verrucomicrobiota bacterium]
MQTVEAIEAAVEQLGRDELAAFRNWFTTYEAAMWDAEIERDIAAGKLDSLADAAIQDFKSGATREL